MRRAVCSKQPLHILRAVAMPVSYLASLWHPVCLAFVRREKNCAIMVNTLCIPMLTLAWPLAGIRASPLPL